MPPDKKKATPMLTLREPSLLRSLAFINGQWMDGFTRQQFTVTDPANNNPIAEVADCGHQETLAAIAAAHKAFPSWRTTPAIERSRLLLRWHDLILTHAEDLARLITAEGGKPIIEARGEVAYGASFVRWFAEEGRRIQGQILASPHPQRRLVVELAPVGVVAAITPWNFPLAMITRKCAPALAAGCTLVVKPAEATPLTALALTELAVQAGFPSGILNVVPTSTPASVGETLATHPQVRKISFTGSTAIGKQLMAQAAGTVKRLSLELGGNAPFLVFDDADLDRAVAGAMAAKFRNSGQTCVCANRFLVQRGIYNAFLDKLTTTVAALKVGPGKEETTQQGPLISMAGLKKVQEHLQDAYDKGARILCGGSPHPLGGTFFTPTVIADVSTSMRLWREETFGPLAAVTPFKDEAEAVALANDTSSGLAAYIYSHDLQRSWRVAEELDYGMVGINEGLIATAEAPFGGMKESGLGREGGHEGLMEFLEPKYLCMGL